MKLVKKTLDGVTIVLPDKDFTYPNVSCTLCSKMYVTIDDQFANEKYQVCDTCMHYFVLPNQQKWLSEGWRPETNVLQEHIKSRARIVKV